MSRHLTRGGWRKFVIYDPTAPDTQAETKDALPPDSLSPEKQYWQTASGKRRKLRKNEVLTVPVTNFENQDIVRGFVDDETNVNAVLVGYERHVQYYEDTFAQIVPAHAAPGGLNADSVTLWNSLRDAAVHHHHSLTAYLGWEDGDSDGIADNWNLSGHDSASFGSGVQDVTYSSDYDFQATVPFPVSGIPLTLVANFTALNGNGDDILRLTARNSSGTATSTAETTVTSTGNAQVSLTTDSDTVEFRAIVRGRNVGSSGTVSFELPTVLTGGIIQPVLS